MVYWLASLIAGVGPALAPPPTEGQLQVVTIAERQSSIVDIQFDESGKPLSCKILNSSGDAAEDKAMCDELMSGRAQLGGPPVRYALPKLVLKLSELPPGTPIPAESKADPDAPALTNLQEVYRTSDYPQEALRAGQQGTVVMALSINSAGRPESCRVTGSSGAPSLDSSSCSLMIARGKFTPAASGTGSRQTTQRVRWMLPTSAPDAMFGDGHARTLFAITADAQLGACSGESNVDNIRGEVMCDMLQSMAASALARLGSDYPLASRSLVYEQGLLVGGPDVARSIGGGAGETLLGLTATGLAVDAAGEVTDCRRIELDTPEIGKANEMCGGARTTRFEPLPTDAANRGDRHAVFYMALYLAARQ